jgi:hypothetical protein
MVKMMKKHPIVVKLLLVLALLGSLVAITAATASANVTAATVTPAPATAAPGYS